MAFSRIEKFVGRVSRNRGGLSFTSLMSTRTFVVALSGGSPWSLATIVTVMEAFVSLSSGTRLEI